MCSRAPVERTTCTAGGNDTYTHFVWGNSGRDAIIDSGGRDKLLLTNYSKSEVRTVVLDVNKNGKADSYGLYLGKGTKNTVLMIGYFDDTRSKPPYYRGPGYIEKIKFFTPSVSTGPELPGP